MATPSSTSALPQSTLLPSRTALAGLLDGVAEPLLLFDDLGRLSFCNREAMRLLGAEPGLSVAQLEAVLGAFCRRFEGHYLDGLIGSWPQVREEYVRRSPLSWCTDIDVPALILQGSADIVVPPGGSRAMATSLLQLGRDVEYHEFPGEGHGWRRRATVRDSMMLTERFLERVLSR